MEGEWILGADILEDGYNFWGAFGEEGMGEVEV